MHLGYAWVQMDQMIQGHYFSKGSMVPFGLKSNSSHKLIDFWMSFFWQLVKWSKASALVHHQSCDYQC
jgi:hypothetical protein